MTPTHPATVASSLISPLGWVEGCSKPTSDMNHESSWLVTGDPYFMAYEIILVGGFNPSEKY